MLRVENSIPNARAKAELIIREKYGVQADAKVWIAKTIREFFHQRGPNDQHVSEMTEAACDLYLRAAGREGRYPLTLVLQRRKDHLFFSIRLGGEFDPKNILKEISLEEYNAWEAALPSRIAALNKMLEDEKGAGGFSLPEKAGKAPKTGIVIDATGWEEFPSEKRKEVWLHSWIEHFSNVQEDDFSGKAPLTGRD
ncbi:Uncharacterised protein [uncultured archaeon]|nr:Uncharacterised protein [uncultured archaeon]